MPYYGARGDYYRGDYYRGDPFLGGLIAKVGGKLLGKAGKWIGKQVGGSARRVGSAIVKAGTSVGLPQVARDVVVGTAGYTLGAQSMPTLGPIGELDQGMGMVPQGGGGNVQIFMSRDGRRIRKRWSVSQQRWVAIRKLNPLNPRALKRGLRRAEGFAKFAKRTMNGLYKPGSVRKFKRKSPTSAR